MGKEEPIKATPELLAAAAATGAAHHLDYLQKSFAQVEESGKADDNEWVAVFQEILRAYYCLASLHASRYISGELLNLYGHKMLNYLLEYPDHKLAAIVSVPLFVSHIYFLVRFFFPLHFGQSALFALRLRIHPSLRALNFAFPPDWVTY